MGRKIGLLFVIAMLLGLFCGGAGTQAQAENIDQLRQQADQGYAEAQCNLGNMYYLGQGVVQDYRQAVAWYQKAADQGIAQAQFVLGFMYAKGHKAYPRITARRWPGIRKPPIRVMPRRNTI